MNFKLLLPVAVWLSFGFTDQTVVEPEQGQSQQQSQSQQPQQQPPPATPPQPAPPQDPAIVPAPQPAPTQPAQPAPPTQPAQPAPQPSPQQPTQTVQQPPTQQQQQPPAQPSTEPQPPAQPAQQTPPPQQPTVPAAPETPPIQTAQPTSVPPVPAPQQPTAAEGVDTQVYDTAILNDSYQSSNYTYAYLGAVLRRALSAQGIKYLAVDVEQPNPGYDDVYESVILNFARSIGAFFNETFGDRSNQYDGHLAVAARVHLPNNLKVNCMALFTRREVDPDLLWVKLSPCQPEWGTREGWNAAKSIDTVGFLNLKTMVFEQTPHVGISAESFKSRRRRN